MVKLKLDLNSVRLPNDLDVNQKLELYDPYAPLRDNNGELLVIPDNESNRDFIKNCVNLTTVLTDTKKKFDIVVISTDKPVPIVDGRGRYDLVSICGLGNGESLYGPSVRVDFEMNGISQSAYTCFDPNNIYRFHHPTSTIDYVGLFFGMLEMWGIKPDDTVVSITTSTNYGLAEIRRDFLFSNLVREFGDHYDRDTGTLNLFGYLTEEMSKQSYASSRRNSTTWNKVVSGYEFS